MEILAWLGVPIAATLVAIGWTHWSSRERGPAQPHDTVAAYERFRSAMGRDERRIR
jgi:hypothetical protein